MSLLVFFALFTPDNTHVADFRNIRNKWWYVFENAQWYVNNSILTKLLVLNKLIYTEAAKQQV